MFNAPEETIFGAQGCTKGGAVRGEAGWFGSRSARQTVSQINSRLNAQFHVTRENVRLVSSVSEGQDLEAWNNRCSTPHDPSRLRRCFMVQLVLGLELIGPVR